MGIGCDDCSNCDTDGSGCDDSNGSSGGSNQEDPDDDDDDDGRCDEGEVKNVNGECVPCPGGNCNDCGEDEFRDICGSCTDNIVSEPMVVEGECNGILTMLEFQDQTDKEISGFFTESGKMIVLTNDHPRQRLDRSITGHQYKDSSGNLLYNFFKNSSGQWRVNYWSNGNVVLIEDIVAHYHTHPWDGHLSDEDREFVNGSFSGIDHYYYLQGNQINEYNAVKVINTENKNCKKNSETINCN